MKLDHESFHVVEFEVGLTFGSGVDGGKNGRIVEIHRPLFTVFFMSSYTRHVPLASPDIAFVLCHSCFRFAGGFSDIGIACVVFTITVELVDDLPGREFCLVFSADNVLQAYSRCEYDRESGFIKDMAKGLSLLCGFKPPSGVFVWASQMPFLCS